MSDIETIIRRKPSKLEAKIDLLITLILAPPDQRERIAIESELVTQDGSFFDEGEGG